MSSKKLTAFAARSLRAATLLACLVSCNLFADENDALEHPTRTDKCEYVGGVALGGVGAGTVELRGDGSFREWQIFNNWGNTTQVALFKNAPSFDLLNAFAAVKVDDKAYVLETHPPEGLPGMSAIKYEGWFPFSNLDYTLADGAPVQVSCEAFGSYVPHHADESAIPAIGLTYHFKNTSAQPVKISLALSLVNPVGKDCKEETAGKFQVTESVRNVSGVALAALDGKAVSLMGGPDNANSLEAFWDAFQSPNPSFPSSSNGQRFGQVVTFQLLPGEEKSERFVIGWFFPNHHENGKGPLVGHKYEAWTDSAAASVNLLAGRFDELRKASANWRDTMRDASWPEWVTHWLDNSQATIDSYTWWVKDGRFMSYESPQCPNSAPVHIIDLADWPVLDAFPEIELGLLRHFAQKQEGSGKIPEEFATGDTTPSVTFPGGRDLYDVNQKYVIEIYHRWRETGDKGFLDATWPSIKRAIDYNNLKFDALKIGIPSGKDIIGTWDHWTNEYGFSYGGSLALASFRAAQELAKVEGDDDFAGQVQSMYDKALATMNDHFWNGEFYGMAIEENLKQNDLSFGEAIYGDSFGRFVGLGSVLPDDKSLATLRAIAKYNNQPTQWGIVATADKSGKMIEYHGDVRAQITTCHEIPAPVALIMEGNQDDIDNGLRILRQIYAIGEKYPGGLWNLPHHVVAATGERNVDDFSHYMRDRCIWALLKVLNGWSYDAANGSLDVGPLLTPEKCHGPWICPTAYGTLSQEITDKSEKVSLKSHEGLLTLNQIRVCARTGKVVSLSVSLDGKGVLVTGAQDGNFVKIKFTQPLKLALGGQLDIHILGLTVMAPQ